MAQTACVDDLSFSSCSGFLATGLVELQQRCGLGLRPHQGLAGEGSAPGSLWWWAEFHLLGLRSLLRAGCCPHGPLTAWRPAQAASGSPLLRRSLTVSRRHGGSRVPLPGSVYEKQASGSALSQGGIVGRRERQKWGVTGGHLRAHSPEQPGYCPRSHLTPRRRPEAPSDCALGKRHAFVDLMLFFVGPVARRDSTAYPGFPGGAAGKNSPANAGDTRDAGSIPGLGRCPGGGNGSLRKYSCLENPMGRGTWWATDRGVSENRARLYTQLSRAGTSPSVT